MVERIEGMPAGTKGLRASGRLEHGAWIEDAKTGLELGIGKRSAWKRFALVTDVEWVEKAMRMFAWMTPGEVKVFDDLDEVDEATRWVAG